MKKTRKQGKRVHLGQNRAKQGKRAVFRAKIGQKQGVSWGNGAKTDF